MTDEYAGWIPLFLSTVEGRVDVEWAFMGAERFTEPFCFETFQKLARRPFNQLFRRQSEFELLLERAQSRPGLPLKGIVFHMSRCGSTLAAQWLAALPDSVVLSEPEPLDTLLQWQADNDAARIRALLAAMGQARRTDDNRLFLKSDCWHVMHIDCLLTAFPDTPWVFIYRDPLEVLVSHRQMPGWHLVPGSMASHGLKPPEELMTYPLGHGAWVMSVILERAQQAILHHNNGLLLNYSALPDALESQLASHFGVDSSNPDLAPLRAICNHHSKHRHIAFQADAVKKRADADEEIQALATRWLNDPYQALEQHRA